MADLADLCIVNAVASQWGGGNRLDQPAYLLATCRHKRASPIIFDCIYIAEAETGDFDTGAVGSFIKRWWRLDAEGLRSINKPDLSAYNSAQGEEFFRTPIIRFYAERDSVLIFEKWGPQVLSAKVGRVRDTLNGVMLDECRVLWNYYSQSDNAT